MKTSTEGLRASALLLILARLSALTLAAQEGQEQVRTHFEKAQTAMREGRYKESEKEYLATLKLNPSLAEARANLGIVYYLDSEYPQAARTLMTALKLRPELTRARLYLGLSQFYLGQYRSSVDSLQEALSGGLDAPFQKLARANLARDYLALDQTEKAIAVLKALVEQYPRDTDLVYTLGKSYLRLSAAAAERLTRAGDTARLHQMLAENFVNQGKFKEAIDEYLEALSLDPKTPGARYPLGLLLLHEGQAEEGRRQLQAVIQADPQNRRARELLEQSRSNTPPKSVLEAALSTPPPGASPAAAGFVDPLAPMPGESSTDARRSLLDRGQVLYSQGRYEEAAVTFKNLAAEKPRDPDRLYWLVKAYQALAIRALDQIAQVAPDSARAHQLLAEGFEKQERWEQAIEEHHHALQQDPRLPGIHYALGLARMKMGQWNEAKKEFESELSLDPFNAGANFRLGQLAYRATEYDDARRYFSRAVEIFPGFGEAQAQLGQVLIKERQYENAIPHLLAATQLTPDDHTIHFQLFHAYRALGEKERSEKELAIFQRMENEKKEATLRKAALSMERIEREKAAQPAATGSTSTLPPTPP